MILRIKRGNLMTDRYFALTVVLEKDKRDDDCEKIIEAIKMIKGVMNVKGNVASIDTWMAEERAKNEIRNKLFDMFFNEDKQ